MVRQTQDRLRSMLATGSEFDQAFARRMLQSLDAEVMRLRFQMAPLLAQELARVMTAADANVIAEATRAVGPIGAVSGIDPVLLQFASENSDNLVQQVTQDMRGRVARVVNQGAIGSSTASDVAREIGSVVRSAGRPQGVFGRVVDQIEKIHRTETARVYEGAADARRQALTKTTGLTVTKTWVHVLRDRQYARPDHDLLDMVEIKQSEHFNVGAGPKWSRVSWEQAKREGGALGFKARGPLDSILPAEQVVRCGCTIAPGFDRRD
jgi:hypothetical protein